ncbi:MULTISPECIES: HigA family addiction module antitoxin [Rhizobium]|uniref:HigA family addiction module antitoxin n=1 Tax=Rhizobium TaxID=379 RepID=UPI00287F6BFD|nr:MULTISPECIES: HigA family addiction module antitoxin [Rhizobium]
MAVTKTKSDGIRRKAPAHPGSFVKTEVIEPLGLSVTAAADVLGVTRAALSALLNERADLSPEMAIRIEKAFGVAMETLMRMQNSFDIAEARKKAEDIDVSPYKGKSSQQIVSL